VEVFEKTNGEIVVDCDCGHTYTISKNEDDSLNVKDKFHKKREVDNGEKGIKEQTEDKDEGKSGSGKPDEGKSGSGKPDEGKSGSGKPDEGTNDKRKIGNGKKPVFGNFIKNK